MRDRQPAAAPVAGATQDVHLGAAPDRIAGAPEEASRAPSRARSGGDIVRALPATGVGSCWARGCALRIAGGTVVVVYLATTTVLAEVVGLPFQVALAIGFCVGLMVHFTLQRLFVWTTTRSSRCRWPPGGALSGRGRRCSTASRPPPRRCCPRALGVSTELVYLATVAAITATNFVVFRNGIFHAKASLPDPLGAPFVEQD